MERNRPYAERPAFWDSRLSARDFTTIPQQQLRLLRQEPGNRLPPPPGTVTTTGAIPLPDLNRIARQHRARSSEQPASEVITIEDSSEDEPNLPPQGATSQRVASSPEQDIPWSSSPPRDRRVQSPTHETGSGADDEDSPSPRVPPWVEEEEQFRRDCEPSSDVEGEIRPGIDGDRADVALLDAHTGSRKGSPVSERSVSPLARTTHDAGARDMYLSDLDAAWDEEESAARFSTVRDGDELAGAIGSIAKQADPYVYAVEDGGEDGVDGATLETPNGNPASWVVEIHEHGVAEVEATIPKDDAALPRLDEVATTATDEPSRDLSNNTAAPEAPALKPSDLQAYHSQNSSMDEEEPAMEVAAPTRLTKKQATALPSGTDMRRPSMSVVQLDGPSSMAKAHAEQSLRHPPPLPNPRKPPSVDQAFKLEPAIQVDRTPLNPGKTGPPHLPQVPHDNVVIPSTILPVIISSADQDAPHPTEVAHQPSPKRKLAEDTDSSATTKRLKVVPSTTARLKSPPVDIPDPAIARRAAKAAFMREQAAMRAQAEMRERAQASTEFKYPTGFTTNAPIALNQRAAPDAAPASAPAADAPTVPSSSSLFQRFQRAYPAYDAPQKHFVRQCHAVQAARRPPALWDDLIVQHYLRYSVYTSECVREGEEPLPFARFYDALVEDPEYTQRVVTPANIGEACPAKEHDAPTGRERSVESPMFVSDRDEEEWAHPVEARPRRRPEPASAQAGSSVGTRTAGLPPATPAGPRAAAAPFPANGSTPRSSGRKLPWAGPPKSTPAPSATPRATPTPTPTAAQLRNFFKQYLPKKKKKKRPRTEEN